MLYFKITFQIEGENDSMVFFDCGETMADCLNEFRTHGWKVEDIKSCERIAKVEYDETLPAVQTKTVQDGTHVLISFKDDNGLTLEEKQNNYNEMSEFGRICWAKNNQNGIGAMFCRKQGANKDYFFNQIKNWFGDYKVLEENPNIVKVPVTD